MSVVGNRKSEKEDEEREKILARGRKLTKVVGEIGMRSSYGKEMEGASSDAKEIEGIVAQPIQPDTSTHNRLHDETNLPTIDWSSTSAPTSIVPCFIMRILPIRCSFLGPSSFIRPD